MEDEFKTISDTLPVIEIQKEIPLETKPISLEATILTPTVKTAIESKLSVISQFQNTALMLNSTKYQQIPLTTEKDYKYEVHELINCKGETGYITYFYKETDGKKYVKSVGIGVDKEQHTHDWTELLTPIGRI